MSGFSIFENNPIVKPKLEKPRFWKITIFHSNDTPDEYIKYVLMFYFNKTNSESSDMIIEINSSGSTIAGIYTYEVAQTKLAIISSAIMYTKVPLKITMEPETTNPSQNVT